MPFTVQGTGTLRKVTDCQRTDAALAEPASEPACYVPKTSELPLLPALKDVMDTPIEHTPRAFPISIKGVAVNGDGQVLLLKNERNEWELPGGKIEIGESPEACVVREVEEETGWEVKAGPLLDTWMYQPLPGRYVFIVTYGCLVLTPDRPPAISNEHKEIGLFAEHEVPGLVMPDGYKQSIATWHTRLRDSRGRGQ